MIKYNSENIDKGENLESTEIDRFYNKTYKIQTNMQPKIAILGKRFLNITKIFGTLI